MADKDMKWKTLPQKYLIEKPWLTAIKQGFKVSSLDEYGTLLVNITSLTDEPLLVQLLNGQALQVSLVV